MESVRQVLIFDCPAHAVYEAFTDVEQHEEVTGAEASIDAVVGGEYHAYDDELVGEFTLLDPDSRIVMRWRPEGVEGWPEGHFAVVAIELTQSSDGTTVEMDITDIPLSFGEAVDGWWQEYYWQPLEKLTAW
jgi:activator of HSP90 ATPase